MACMFCLCNPCFQFINKMFQQRNADLSRKRHVAGIQWLWQSTTLLCMLCCLNIQPFLDHLLRGHGRQTAVCHSQVQKHRAAACRLACSQTAWCIHLEKSLHRNNPKQLQVADLDHSGPELN
jgi:hypothetical protein